MDEKNAETRKKLKQITCVTDFESILENAMMSEEDKQLLRLHYKEQKPLGYIADVLGMSEITVKKRHKKLLNKIGSII